MIKKALAWIELIIACVLWAFAIYFWSKHIICSEDLFSISCGPRLRFYGLSFSIWGSCCLIAALGIFKWQRLYTQVFLLPGLLWLVYLYLLSKS